MASIELDHHINNLIFTLDRLRAGRDAKRYGHAMSAADTQTYNAAREIIAHLLAQDYDNAGDDELITGMEQYITNVMETRNAQSNSIQ